METENVKADIKCPCSKKDCERHGKCAECREYHAGAERKRAVACERKKKSVFAVFR